MGAAWTLTAAASKNGKPGGRCAGSQLLNWSRLASIPIEHSWLLPGLEHRVHGAAIHRAWVIVENDIGRPSRPLPTSPDPGVLDVARDHMSQKVTYGPVRTGCQAGYISGDVASTRAAVPSAALRSGSTTFI